MNAGEKLNGGPSGTAGGRNPSDKAGEAINIEQVILDNKINPESKPKTKLQTEILNKAFPTVAETNIDIFKKPVIMLIKLIAKDKVTNMVYYAIMDPDTNTVIALVKSGEKTIINEYPSGNPLFSLDKLRAYGVPEKCQIYLSNDSVVGYMVGKTGLKRPDNLSYFDVLVAYKSMNQPLQYRLPNSNKTVKPLAEAYRKRPEKAMKIGFEPTCLQPLDKVIIISHVLQAHWNDFKIGETLVDEIEDESQLTVIIDKILDGKLARLYKTVPKISRREDILRTVGTVLIIATIIFTFSFIRY